MSLSFFILFVCALVAFALSAVCGGGAGLLLMPVLGSLLPGAQVPAALSVGTVSSSISRIVVFRSQVRWDLVVWFVPPALPAVWLGARLLSFVNPLYIELLMGLFLVANLPLIFRPNAEMQTPHALPKFYLLLIGATAGFVSGLTGAVGLLFNRFYLRYGLRKEQIVVTRAANELLLHVVKLSLYASFGLLSGKAIEVGAVVALAALLSSWGMKWLLPRLSENRFRRIGYGAMVVSGLSLFGGAGSRLAAANQLDTNYTPISGGIETQVQWRQGIFALEFEYDEGFEYEHRITLSDLPVAQKARVKSLSRGADRIILEEVFGINKHYYEVYVFRKGKLEKFDI
ncbi:sulfite exporter TauE/SafE family protein [Larkinella sp. C7]|uniref:sulfite exporter TauE/SafE family protein n=1 Tax=Larkinella sp. C7 TaxID=2576607 RepID=UPI00111126ED|nr:sulfite exporter TauE/SafE family protein [Larkinella sp. C7]